MFGILIFSLCTVAMAAGKMHLNNIDGDCEFKWPAAN